MIIIGRVSQPDQERRQKHFGFFRIVRRGR